VTLNCRQWLFRRLLLIDPATEGLCGDLLEELERGRSRGWFWRQLLFALITTMGRQAWATRRSTAEASAIGCVMLLVLLFATYVTVLLGAIVVYRPWMTLLNFVG